MQQRIALPPQFDRPIMVGAAIAGATATPLLIVLVVLRVIGQISNPEVVFWLAFSVVLAGALGTVLFSNIVHAALALVFTLLGIAAIYLLLGQEFLALAQILVYGGGVTILIVFGLMMTNATDDPIVSDGAQKPFAFGVGILLALVFIAALLAEHWPEAGPAVISGADFGLRLFGDYTLVVLIVGVLLDIALSGALLIARPVAPAAPEESAE
jgi:NADH-quinone oxidoreductase subunit J